MHRGGGPGAWRYILDDTDRLRISAMFLKGESKPAIAEAIGCTVGGVYHTLVKMGLHERKPAKYRRVSPRTMASLHRLGG